MKTLKVAALVLLVLVTMRAVSWILQWMLLRLARTGGGAGVVAGNLAAFALFASFVWWNLVPGEPMDLEAVLFGLVVFGLCAAADLRWSPWRRRR